MDEGWRPVLDMDCWVWIRTVGERHARAAAQGKMTPYWSGDRPTDSEVICHVFQQHQGQRIRRRRANAWRRIRPRPI